MIGWLQGPQARRCGGGEAQEGGGGAGAGLDDGARQEEGEEGGRGEGDAALQVWVPRAVQPRPAPRTHAVLRYAVLNVVVPPLGLEP